MTAAPWLRIRSGRRFGAGGRPAHATWNGRGAGRPSCAGAGDALAEPRGHGLKAETAPTASEGGIRRFGATACAPGPSATRRTVQSRRRLRCQTRRTGRARAAQRGDPCRVGRRPGRTSVSVRIVPHPAILRGRGRSPVPAHGPQPVPARRHADRPGMRSAGHHYSTRRLPAGNARGEPSPENHRSLTGRP